MSLHRVLDDRQPEPGAAFGSTSTAESFTLMGKLVERTKTDKMFVSPQHQETADYIEGRYG